VELQQLATDARDRFYPRELFEETQQLIPGSVLLRVPGRGRLTAMASSQSMSAVWAFLA